MFDVVGLLDYARPMRLWVLPVVGASGRRNFSSSSVGGGNVERGCQGSVTAGRVR